MAVIGLCADHRLSRLKTASVSALAFEWDFIFSNFSDRPVSAAIAAVFPRLSHVGAEA